MAVKESPRLSAGYANVLDDFDDGIPCLSLALRRTKVSQASSLITGAGGVGLGRAVKMLKLPGRFISGATTKNDKISILAFEVANSIVKGSNLMQSLSEQSIRQLKEVVLPAEGVQQLISKEMDELLKIVAADKREELKFFSREVVRFGNQCKDPQFHNLDRYFFCCSRSCSIAGTPLSELGGTVELVMLQLMTSVQLTAELYQEMHTLDLVEQDYQHKRLEEFRYSAAQRGGKDSSIDSLPPKLKRQWKLVKNLKKKSLWSRGMEELIGSLVGIVIFLIQEINHTFGNPEGETPEKEIIPNKQKLGPAGLALHYANIILQIDAIVACSSSMSQYSRDTLYQSLPPNIKYSLQSKLHSFHVEKELTIREIEDEMKKTLRWLVPVATNTARAHHGFGWAGEWVNIGMVGPINVMQIETLHHADKQKTECYILDLLLWLNYLVSRSKARSNRVGAVRPFV